MKRVLNVRPLPLAAAFAIGLGALGALPASNAARADSFGLSIHIGDGYGKRARYGHDGNYRDDHRYGNRRDYEHRRLSPVEVRYRLRHYGFRRIQDVDYRSRGPNGVYTAYAWRQGQPYRVVVDARSGELLRRRPQRNW